MARNEMPDRRTVELAQARRYSRTGSLAVEQWMRAEKT